MLFFFSRGTLQGYSFEEMAEILADNIRRWAHIRSNTIAFATKEQVPRNGSVGKQSQLAETDLLEAELIDLRRTNAIQPYHSIHAAFVRASYDSILVQYAQRFGCSVQVKRGTI